MKKLLWQFALPRLALLLAQKRKIQHPQVAHPQLQVQRPLAALQYNVLLTLRMVPDA